MKIVFFLANLIFIAGCSDSGSSAPTAASAVTTVNGKVTAVANLLGTA